MGLKQKTVAGLFWTFTQQFSLQIISFIISIILARQLSPSEFGLIGMLSVFISVGSSLMDSGMTSSIIRTKDPNQSDYSTVFVINIVGSILIYAIIFFAAPYIAAFYNHPILTDIVRVYSLTFVLSAFMGVQRAKLTKEMNFRLQMLIQIPSVVGSGILGIILAYNGFGVWSLVYMYVLQSFLLSVQHWMFSGWRPDLKFDLKRFKYHFDFGYKITLSGLIKTIYENIFTIIIGKYYSAAQLGFYNRALSIRQLPISNLSIALGKVTYPLLSSINNDDVKLKEVYKKLIKQVVFWVVPILILLIVIAEPFFRFLLTEKWLPAVPYFQILCVTGILIPLQAYNSNIFKVKGRTDITLKMTIIKKIFGITGILIAIQFGIFGLLYFQLISTAFDYNLDAHFGGKLINYSIFEQIKDIIPSVSLAVIIGVLTWTADGFLFKSIALSDLLRLVFAGIFYFTMYLGISHLIKLSAAKDFRQLVLKK
ncbi:lipopolysaccharide biosynthesis protein [Daejeonella oryzae]|uniref:lipopolysaccharide biosynthesis protein n=1 Tax=Daejeonella oryzae TaxID=1122943 RepID=UPI00047E333D|nr:lipopolysaccharide biosynthesis protein [Daejeonella oryzae]